MSALELPSSDPIPKQLEEPHAPEVQDAVRKPATDFAEHILQPAQSCPSSNVLDLETTPTDSPFHHSCLAEMSNEQAEDILDVFSRESTAEGLDALL